jgi:hypothetical protein
VAALGHAIRRARARLGPFEGLLGSVLGRERGGRRRVAIVATDRRVLLVSLRPEPPVELAYGDLSADLVVDDGHAAVTLRTDEATHAVDRVGDVAAARLLVDLISQRTDVPDRPASRPGVRIVAWSHRRRGTAS